MTVRWTVRAAEPTEQGCARGETEALLHFSCTAGALHSKKSLLSVDKRDFFVVIGLRKRYSKKLMDGVELS